MSQLFSCKDIGWCCFKKHKEPEIVVEQVNELTYHFSPEGNRKGKDNNIERTNCFCISKERKKGDKIKRIRIKRVWPYSNCEEKQLEDITLLFENTEQSIKCLRSSIE